MPTSIDVHDYQQLYRRTRGIRGDIRRDFRKHLRDAAKIGQRAARDKIRQMPARGRYTAAGHGRHRRSLKPVGLRSTLALNIRVQVTNRGVFIRQFTEGLRGRNARDLPKVLERGAYKVSGGWLHPVFGHGPDVFQKSYPYFKDEIDSKREEMLQQVQQLLDDLTKRLTV